MIRTPDLLYSRTPKCASTWIAGRLLTLPGAERLPGPSHRGLASEPAEGRLRLVSIRDPWSWHVSHYHHWLNADGTPGDRLTCWGAVPHEDPVEQLRATVRLMVDPDPAASPHLGAWPGMLAAAEDCHTHGDGLLSWAWAEHGAAATDPDVTPGPTGIADAIIDATRATEALQALAAHLGLTIEDVPPENTATSHRGAQRYDGDPRDLLGEDLCALIEEREALPFEAWRLAHDNEHGLWLREPRRRVDLTRPDG